MTKRKLPFVVFLTFVSSSTLLAGCARRGGDSMSSSLWPVRHVSVSIARPPGEVYDLAANPENLPRWAQGLASSVGRSEGDTWVATSPMGRIRIRFAERNRHGVLDHDVTLESGVTVHNPLRVVPNAGGSEVVFTIFRRPGATEAQFEADSQAVTRDLAALKALLER
jgi:hypothetical protein